MRKLIVVSVVVLAAAIIVPLANIPCPRSLERPPGREAARLRLSPGSACVDPRRGRVALLREPGRQAIYRHLQRR